MTLFAHRFAAISKARSPLCLGLDPSAELLAGWGLTQDAAGLEAFCARVLEAAGDLVGVVKPQAGFFERFGAAGMVELARAIGQAQAQGALCLLDAKRGDVPGTMEGYAQALVGPGGFAAVAATLNPYLGFDSLAPAFARAQAYDAALFVVVRSSNPGGRDLQAARHTDGRAVAERLADQIAAHNAQARPVLGAVIGATLQAQETGLLERLGEALVLAPGVGAQGATMAQVGERFAAVRGRVLPSVSRDILRAGPDVASLRAAILRYRDEAWDACGA
ncbi:orotidine-5'-phosphate decarboxylase [Phenylobacterium sp.]|uniref:orotidine-5'-phosphate decarboxylase n=1 Tax=Phenylobacterium sp. TaxID=1871053 RepID=UPI0035B0C545